MKNKSWASLGILLIAIPVILIVLGMIFKLILAVITLICIGLGIFVLMDWSTKNYVWVCTECNNEVEISLKENIFGHNCGINCKTLYCPNCNRETICNGIKKRR